MSFAFGSHVKGTATTESDFDIAVYFTPENRLPEWGAETNYPGEDEIWGDVERIVGVETDLVTLNRAPATLAASVLLEGTPILVKDRSLYWSFFLGVTAEAEDFHEFVKDYWAIKRRSHSLVPNDRSRLVRLVDFLMTELDDVENFEDLSQADYDSDSSRRRDVERWVENIVNVSIDIAKICLAASGKKIPMTYRETLSDLATIDGFDKQVAEELARFALLRNILAHEYLDIRYPRIERFIERAPWLYGTLIESVQAFLRRMESEFVTDSA